MEDIVKKLKFTLANGYNKEYYLFETYGASVYKLIDMISKTTDLVFAGDALDTLIKWCVLYCHKRVLRDLCDRKFAIPTSKYYDLMVRIGFCRKKFDNAYKQSILARDYETVRRLSLFAWIIPHDKVKFYRLAIQDICMINVFIKERGDPGQAVLMSLVRSGFITNTIYYMERRKIKVSDEILFSMYKLAIERFNSQRLFDALYRLYNLPESANVYDELLLTNPEFCSKLKYEDRWKIKNFYKKTK